MWILTVLVLQYSVSSHAYNSMVVTVLNTYQWIYCRSISTINAISAKQEFVGRLLSLTGHPISSSGHICLPYIMHTPHEYNVKELRSVSFLLLLPIVFLFVLTPKSEIVNIPTQNKTKSISHSRCLLLLDVHLWSASFLICFWSFF